MMRLNDSVVDTSRFILETHIFEFARTPENLFSNVVFIQFCFVVTEEQQSGHVSTCSHGPNQTSHSTLHSTNVVNLHAFGLLLPETEAAGKVISDPIISELCEDSSNI